MKRSFCAAMRSAPCGLSISTGNASKNSLAKITSGTSGDDERISSETRLALRAQKPSLVQ